MKTPSWKRKRESLVHLLLTATEFLGTLSEDLSFLSILSGFSADFLSLSPYKEILLEWSGIARVGLTTVFETTIEEEKAGEKH